MTGEIGAPKARAMTRARFLIGTHRHFALALVVLALFARLVVPTGFMPQATSHGMVITMCTGQGAVNITLPGEPLHHKASADMPCAFAAGLGTIAAPVLAALPAPLFIAFALPVGRAIAHLTVHRLAAPPPPSQGPPALR
ncbi:MAG: hypothetical protein ABI395_10540 [Sphingobium sp.]